MIYHVTSADRWAQSCALGHHTESTRGVELADEGFIHCSTADQVAGVLDRFYSGLTGLVLLHIDEGSIDVPVVWERVGDAPAEFPHVYGPIPVVAVVRVEDIVSGY